MADTFKGIITADGKKRQLPYSAVWETPVSDETLSIQGAFADAKVVGDKFKKTKVKTDSLKEDLAAETSRATAVEDTKADKTALARTDRSLNALWKLNQGISYEFQTDDTVAYQKTVPSGAKMANVKSIGGKTIVWNQLYPYDLNNSEILAYVNSCKLEIVNGIATVYFYAEKSGENPNVNFGAFFLDESIPGHTYLVSEEIQASEEIQVEVFGSNVHLTNNYKKVSIIKKADNITSLNYLNYIICREQYNNDFTVKFRKIQLFDLTRMFGSGNEPSTPEEFETMFPADYYPYNAGELMSAPVNEVVEQGKNLFDINNIHTLFKKTETSFKISSKLYNTDIFTGTSSYTVSVDKLYYDKLLRLDKGTYIITFDSDIQAQSLNLMIVSSDGTVREAKYGLTSGGSFAITESGMYTIRVNNNIPVCFFNFQIENASISTPYSPYHKTSYPIPQAILGLDGYGDGVTDNVYNYVDWENKKYHKRVGKYTIDGSEGIYKEESYWVMTVTDFEKPGPSTKNAICVNFKTGDGYLGKWGDVSFRRESNGFVFSDSESKFANSNEVKDYFRQNNETIYYELNEEQIIDISDIVDNTFQEPIEVESGGSLTFRNTHGANYRVPVPNTVEYTVKLSEVAK